MNPTPEQLALRHAHRLCLGHNEALRDALTDLGQRKLAAESLDRRNRREQLDWRPSADVWSKLRRIRNEFTHDDPETIQERHDRLQLAIQAARRLLEVLEGMSGSIGRRFPGLA